MKVTRDLKDPVRLRRRTLANGNISLYLDVYINGRRTYEFLKLYLVPEANRKDKEKNRETLRLAEDVRAKRILELRNGEFGFKNLPHKDVLFFDYYEAYVEKRKFGESKGNWGNLRSSLRHLRKYEPRSGISFSDITPEWIEGYRNYLERDARSQSDQKSSLAPNTRRSYFNNLRSCISQAVKDEIIQRNPMAKVKGIKGEETNRMYLTLEEIRAAAQAPCDNDVVKRAFLFSCLTGLRRSDLIRLTWGDITRQNDFTRIIFRQKKTKGQEYLDITPQATEFLGNPGAPGDKPFEGLLCVSVTNYEIKTWLARAGITKPITFHCARHSFAVMMLDLGTDIYTVSKLLGHRELSTTQIYAKVLDKNKQAAVASIPSILDSPAEKKTKRR